MDKAAKASAGVFTAAITGIWSHIVGDFKHNRGKWVIGSAAAIVLIGGGLKVVSGSSTAKQLAVSAVAPEAEAATKALGGAHAKLRARSPVVK